MSPTTFDVRVAQNSPSEKGPASRLLGGWSLSPFFWIMSHKQVAINKYKVNVSKHLINCWFTATETSGKFDQTYVDPYANTNKTQKHNHTTPKTQSQKKSTTQPQKHNHATTKTQPHHHKNTKAQTQRHHHKNTTVPPQKNTTTPPQKHNHGTTTTGWCKTLRTAAPSVCNRQ